MTIYVNKHIPIAINVYLYLSAADTGADVGPVVIFRCSVEVDREGVHVEGRRGHCRSDCVPLETTRPKSKRSIECVAKVSCAAFKLNICVGPMHR